MRCGRGSRTGTDGREGTRGSLGGPSKRDMTCHVLGGSLVHVWGGWLHTRLRVRARSWWKGGRRLILRAWSLSGRGLATREDQGEKREVHLVENRRRCRERTVNATGKPCRRFTPQVSPLVSRQHKHASRDTRGSPCEELARPSRPFVHALAGRVESSGINAGRPTTTHLVERSLPLCAVDGMPIGAVALSGPSWSSVSDMVGPTAVTTGSC